MVRRLADIHLDRLAVIDGGGNERIVDKMPENYLYLGLLAVLFPNAVFIHCRRDLRDVAVSCWMTDFTSIRWANDPAHIASRFQQYRRVMDHWSTVLPVAIHHVDYEENVADLESVARRLIDACGLEWEPACLDFHQTQRPVRTASVTQVRQPVYTRSVARWKNYWTSGSRHALALATDDATPTPGSRPTIQRAAGSFFAAIAHAGYAGRARRERAMRLPRRTDIAGCPPVRARGTPPTVTRLPVRVAM